MYIIGLQGFMLERETEIERENLHQNHVKVTSPLHLKVSGWMDPLCGMCRQFSGL